MYVYFLSPNAEHTLVQCVNFLLFSSPSHLNFFLAAQNVNSDLLSSIIRRSVIMRVSSVATFFRS